MKWLGKPVFIRHRTEEEIAKALEQDKEAEGSLPDPFARNVNLPDPPRWPPTRNRTLPSPVGEAADAWWCRWAFCTHLGCVPLGDFGRFRRVVLPLPRVALRHGGPHPQRTGAAEPAHPPVAWVDGSTIKLG